MVDQSLRNAIIESLKQRLLPQVSVNYERRIYKMCKRMANGDEDVSIESIYKKMAYEKTGQLLNAKNRMEREKILLDIRGTKFGWDSVVYINYKQRLAKDASQLAAGIKVEKGEFPCKNKKCRSMECYYYQQQDRSSDEGFSVYVVCTKCGGRYKFN